MLKSSARLGACTDLPAPVPCPTLAIVAQVDARPPRPPARRAPLPLTRAHSTRPPSLACSFRARTAAAPPAVRCAGADARPRPPDAAPPAPACSPASSAPLAPACSPAQPPLLHSRTRPTPLGQPPPRAWQEMEVSRECREGERLGEDKDKGVSSVPNWNLNTMHSCLVLGQKLSGADYTFLSSFRGSLLVEGLSTQVRWGHVWNRYAGPLSCRRQPHQLEMGMVQPWVEP
ncbi:hypothetical protein HU200_062859 [Digitaria exilis]|uniref:Uncharacterized protein n=1 Tax=Digitaria exilis TaxID=1010633 RepID=A0A835A6Q7_9POAL|nr:hypothetical protein HU200_062859 [Digitaria exilis]